MHIIGTDAGNEGANQEIVWEVRPSPATEERFRDCEGVSKLRRDQLQNGLILVEVRRRLGISWEPCGVSLINQVDIGTPPGAEKPRFASAQTRHLLANGS